MDMTVREVYDHWVQENLNEGRLHSREGLDDSFARYMGAFANRKIKDVQGLEVSGYFIHRFSKERWGWKEWSAIRLIVYYVFAHGEELGEVGFDLTDTLLEVELALEDRGIKDPAMTGEEVCRMLESKTGSSQENDLPHGLAGKALGKATKESTRRPTGEGSRSALRVVYRNS